MQKSKTMIKNLRMVPVFLLVFGINGQVNATVLIEDDFNDDVIDTSKWITGGSDVTEHDGILDIQQNITDAGGWAKTVEFAPTKKLRLEIEHTMHTKSYAPNYYGEYFYFPHFFFESIQPEGGFAVQWHRSDYPSDYCNDENYHNKVSIGGFGGCYAASNLTSSDYYDRKIKSVITYDSVNGDIKLDIGGDGTADFSAVAPADKRFPIKQVHIGGYGWWTGHYHQIDSFKLESLDISANLDMTQANCRYVAPVYDKMWQQMKVKKAPTCGAVLRYHTWVNSTRPENYTAGNYYSDRLANIDTSNQLFNARLKLIDDGISILSDVLDPDLRKAFTPEGYQSTVNIMKTKGIVKSLAAGKTPFKLNTLKGKILNKAFKDKIIGEGISGGSSEWLCHQFLDGAVAESCSNEAKKVATCGVGLATEGWKGAAGCVIGGVTTFTGFINSVFDIGQIVSIKQHNYGYVLINDYLNDYYAKGSTVTALDEVKLEADIQKYADQLSLSSGGLFTFADFDMQFVKDGIRDSILRNLVKANANIRTVEQLRAILNK